MFKLLNKSIKSKSRSTKKRWVIWCTAIGSATIVFGAVASVIVLLNHHKKRKITRDNILSVKDTILRSMAKNLSEESIVGFELQNALTSADSYMSKIINDNSGNLDKAYNDVAVFGMQHNCDVTDWYQISSSLKANISEQKKQIRGVLEKDIFNKETNNLDNLIDQCKAKVLTPDATAEALKSRLYQTISDYQDKFADSDNLKKPSVRMEMYLEDFLSSVALSRSCLELSYSTFKDYVLNKNIPPMLVLGSAITYGGEPISSSSLCDYLNTLAVKDPIVNGITLGMKILNWNDEKRMVSFKFVASLPVTTIDNDLDESYEIDAESKSNYEITLLPTPQEERQELANKFDGKIQMDPNTKYDLFLNNVVGTLSADNASVLLKANVPVDTSARVAGSWDLSSIKSFFIYDNTYLDEDFFNEYSGTIKAYKLDSSTNTIYWSYDIYKNDSLASMDFNDRGFHSGLQVTTLNLSDACYKEVLDSYHTYMGLKKSYSPDQIPLLQKSADCDIALLTENIIMLILGTAQLVVDIIFAIVTLGVGVPLIISGVIGLVGTGIAIGFMPSIMDHYNKTKARIATLVKFQSTYGIAIKDDYLISTLASKAASKTLSLNEYFKAIDVIGIAIERFNEGVDALSKNFSKSIETKIENKISTVNRGNEGDVIDDLFATLDVALRRMYGDDRMFGVGTEWSVSSFTSFMDGITKALNDRLETLLQNVDSMLSHNRMISQFFTKLEKGFFGKSALVRVGDMVFAADKTMGQILLEAFTRKPSFTNREIANRLRIHFPEETKSLIGVFNLEGIRGTGLSDDVFNMTRVEEIVQVLRESYFAGADVNPKPAEMLIQQIGEMSKRQNSELSISSASFAGMQNELTSRARDVRDFMKNMGDPSYVMNLTQDEAAAAMNDLRLRIGRLGRTLAEVQQTFDQSIGPAGKSVAVWSPKLESVPSTTSQVFFGDVSKLEGLARARRSAGIELTKLFNPTEAELRSGDSILNIFPNGFIVDPDTGTPKFAFESAITISGAGNFNATKDARVELCTLRQIFGNQEEHPISIADDIAGHGPEVWNTIRAPNATGAREVTTRCTDGQGVFGEIWNRIMQDMSAVNNSMEANVGFMINMGTLYRQLKQKRPSATFFDIFVSVMDSFSEDANIQEVRNFAKNFVFAAFGMELSNFDGMVKTSVALGTNATIMSSTDSCARSLRSVKGLKDDVLFKNLPFLAETADLTSVQALEHLGNSLSRLTEEISAAPTPYAVSVLVEGFTRRITGFKNLILAQSFLQNFDVNILADNLSRNLGEANRLIEDTLWSIKYSEALPEHLVDSTLYDALRRRSPGHGITIKGMFSDTVQVRGQVSIALNDSISTSSMYGSTRLTVGAFTPMHDASKTCRLNPADWCYYSDALIREGNPTGKAQYARVDFPALTDEEVYLIRTVDRSVVGNDMARIEQLEAARSAQNAAIRSDIPPESAERAQDVTRKNLAKRLWDSSWEYFDNCNKLLTEKIGPLGRVLSQINNPIFLIAQVVIDLSFNIITSVLQANYDEMAASYEYASF